MTPKTLADGTRQIRSQVIYLGSNISQAPGTVYLHLGDLTASPGTDARIYLAGLGADTLDPANYIGSFAMVGGGPAGEPVTIASHTLEVTDFEAGGRRYHARSSLRVFGHFGLVVMVKAGSLTIGRAVLSTKALRDRHP